MRTMINNMNLLNVIHHKKREMPHTESRIVHCLSKKEKNENRTTVAYCSIVLRNLHAFFWEPSEHVLGHFKYILNAHTITRSHTYAHAIRLVIIDPNLMSSTRNNNHNNYQYGVTMMDNMLQLCIIINMWWVMWFGENIKSVTVAQSI
jgi:hypothetical protein